MKRKKNTASLIELTASKLDPNPIGSENLNKMVTEWKSLPSVVLSLVIEAEYGVLLEKEDYNNANTISDLEDIIRKMYS